MYIRFIHHGKRIKKFLKNEFHSAEEARRIYCMSCSKLVLFLIFEI